MAVIQKFKVLFFLRKKTTSNTRVSLYIRVSVDGSSAEIATTHKIELKDWDSKKQRVKPNNQNGQLINLFLDNCQSKLGKLFLQETSLNKKVTPKELKNLFLGISTEPEKPKAKTLMDTFDYHNTKMLELVQIGKVVSKTHQRYEITRNKVKDFMQLNYKVNDMDLIAIRLRFVTEFEHFLLTVHKIQNNTAHKYIKNLKKILSTAVALDWISVNPFAQFRCSYHQPDIRPLDLDEINILINKKIGIQRLEEVRDSFIFSCFTAFAYTEALHLTPDCIVKDLLGDSWLTIIRQKTNKRVNVPILPPAQKIIDKYRNHPECQKKNTLLPIKSNQNYNAYLKELADICGIKKKLTTHLARHTFGSTIAVAHGVPLETLMDIMGHASIRTTQQYVKISGRKVSEDMKILSEKLNPKLDFENLAS